MGSATSSYVSNKRGEKASKPIVNTVLGQTRGFALTKAKCEGAKQVFAFMGLPFAKPPVGELRFEPPRRLIAKLQRKKPLAVGFRRKEPWIGIWDANKSPPIPMQTSYFAEMLHMFQPHAKISDENFTDMSEDCLYLNVFTSKVITTAKMPVLFWLYGGAFSIGSSIGYNGQVLCGLHDVVLVVPQYRVNVFGFFTTGKDTKWPGNMGLLDQVMALEWVRDNIIFFGGDPDNVTIMGQSAGSASVSMHVTSPLSRGLFHKAISQSGVGMSPSFLKPDLSEEREELFKELNISVSDPDQIMLQMKAMDSTRLLEALNTKPMKTMFLPTADGRFNPKHTTTLLTEGQSYPCPYILGFTNSEGYGILSAQFPPTFGDGLTKEVAVDAAKNMLKKIAPAEKLDTVCQTVVDFYCEHIEDDKYKWSKMLGSIMSDSLIGCATIAQAAAHSKAGNSTYLYYMTEPMRMHHDKAYSKEVGKKSQFCKADHCDDVMMTFGYPLMDCKFTLRCKFSPDEVELSRCWMKSICQFAKSG